MSYSEVLLLLLLMLSWLEGWHINRCNTAENNINELLRMYQLRWPKPSHEVVKASSRKDITRCAKVLSSKINFSTFSALAQALSLTAYVDDGIDSHNAFSCDWTCKYYQCCYWLTSYKSFALSAWLDVFCVVDDVLCHDCAIHSNDFIQWLNSFFDNCVL